MADTQNDDAAELAAINRELQRRGVSAPASQGAPVAAAPASDNTQAAPAQEADPMGAAFAAGDMAGTTSGGNPLTDIVKGVAWEGPGAIVRGVGNAIKEHGDFVTEAANLVKEKAGPVGSAIVAGASSAAGSVVAVAPAISWVGEKIASLYAPRETVTGSIVEGIAQLGVGLVGAGKFTSLPKAVVAAKGGKVLEAMAKGAVADTLAFDGNDKRLANLLEDFPGIWTPVTDFLAAKDDDPEMLGRVKNALEGLVIGPVADLLLMTLKARKAFANGDIKGGKDAAATVEDMLAKMREHEMGGSPADVAMKSLDPENGRSLLPGDKPVDAAKQSAPHDAEPTAKAADAPRITAFHGTGRTFDEFDPKFQSQGAFFFSDNADVALKHGGNKKVLPTELAMDNPMTVDWGGGIYGKEKMDDILRQAKDGGHDGVVITNIKDFSDAPPSTTYAVFKPEQAKILKDGGAKAADEGIPKPEKIEADPAAPYSTDLTAPKGHPVITEAQGHEAIKALQSKFAVAGKAMVETGADFNFRTIVDDDDLKAAMNVVSKSFEDEILKAKGGNSKGILTERALIKQRDEIADMFGADPDHMMIALGRDADTMLTMAARFQAYKMMMQKATNDAANLASAALLNDGSQAGGRASAEALHSVMIAAKIQAMVKGIQSNTARTLNAMKLAAPSDVLKKGLGDYEELAKRLENGTFHTDDKKLLTQIAALKDNPKGFNKLMEQTFSDKAKGAYVEYFLNALLSGPKTHIANFLGNSVMAAYMPMERAVAGMMYGSGKSTGEVLTRLKDEYDGMGMALLDSFRVAGTALKQNRSVLDPHNSTLGTVPGVQGGLSSRALGLTKDIHDVNGNLIRTEATPMLSGMMDGVQTVVGIPSRLLTASDELFKQINYRSYLYVDAADKARKAGLKNGTPEFKNFVSQEMTRGFDDMGTAAAISHDSTVRGVNGENSRAGLDQAREATFTQDLEYGVSRWLQGMSNDSPWAKTIIPFVRTPVNIFRFAIKHGPLAPIEAGWRRDLAAGGDRGRKAAAQLSTGMAMWTTAVWLANNEAITGGFSPDPEVRKIQESNGAKEYAVRVGDQYIQYNRMEPFATVMGFAADFAKLAGHISEADADKLGKAMTITLARNLLSKTYVQGLSNMFNAVSDAMSGRSTTGLDTFLYRTASSIAVPSIVGSFKDDEALREVRNMLDGFKARLPGYSKEVPAVRNFIGEIVDAPQGWLLGSMSPLGYGRDKGDKLYGELAKLMEATGSPLARIAPTLGETKIDLREVTMETGQNGYDRLQQLLWEGGVKKALTDLVQSPTYQNAQTGSLDFPNADGSKSWLITHVVQGYREAARQKLLAESPALRAMEQVEMKRAHSEGVLGPQPSAYEKPSILQSIIGGRPNDLRTK